MPDRITDTDRLEWLTEEGWVVNYRPYHGNTGLKAGYWLEHPDTGEIQQVSFPKFRDAIDAMMRSAK